MEDRVLAVFDGSLRRCVSSRGFADRFYEKFLSSSPKVREKFAETDFVRQKRALRASLHLLLLAAMDEKDGPQKYLHDLAVRHSSKDLDIGAELYDLWLDSLLEAVEEQDEECTPEVLEAWEKVMGVGIRYLLSHYRDPPN